MEEPMWNRNRLRVTYLYYCFFGGMIIVSAFISTLDNFPNESDSAASHLFEILGILIIIYLIVGIHFRFPELRGTLVYTVAFGYLALAVIIGGMFASAYLFDLIIQPVLFKIGSGLVWRLSNAVFLVATIGVTVFFERKLKAGIQELDDPYDF